MPEAAKSSRSWFNCAPWIDAQLLEAGILYPALGIDVDAPQGHFATILVAEHTVADNHSAERSRVADRGRWTPVSLRLARCEREDLPLLDQRAGDDVNRRAEEATTRRALSPHRDS